MKSWICILVFYLIISACKKDDYYYLNSKEFNGCILKSNKEGVFKMNLKVIAESKCNSFVNVQIRGTTYKFKVNTKLDTIISTDWYDEPMFIKVKIDSCIIDEPIVGVRFVDKVY